MPMKRYASASVLTSGPYLDIRFLILLLTLVCFAPRAEADVIVLKNGDRLTGDIEKIQAGLLHLDASYGDNIFIIEWEEIETLESDGQYVLEMSHGGRLSGAIEVLDTGEVQVTSGEVSNVVEQEEVVRADPFESDLWSRMDISIDLGASVTKANSTKTSNLGARAQYRAELWQASAVLDSTLTYISEADPARRNNLNLDWNRLIKSRWFGRIGSTFQQSDEQQLNLRTTISPGFGRYLTRSNRAYLMLSGGAQWTSESFQGGVPRANGAEAWATVEYNRFDAGDLDFIFRLTSAPSLTDAGRIRFDGHTEVRWDLPKDLYFNVKLTDTYDSRPPNDAPRNDYTFSTGVGWEL